MDKAEIRLQVLKLVHTPVKSLEEILHMARIYESYIANDLAVDSGAVTKKVKAPKSKQSDNSIFD